MSESLPEPSSSVVDDDDKSVASSKELVEWKRSDLVKSLKQAKLKSLISLEMPPEACLPERLDRMLAWQEHARDTMKILPLYGLKEQDCQSTLESIIGVVERLKCYENLPKNGLCVHSGLVVAKNGQERRLTFEYEPVASTDHEVAHSMDGPDFKFSTRYLNFLLGHNQDENIFIGADASEILSEVEVSDCKTEVTVSNSSAKAQQEEATVASIRPESGGGGGGGGKTNDASTSPMLAKNKNVWKISRLLEGLFAAKNASQIGEIFGSFEEHFMFLTTDVDIQSRISSMDNCLHKYYLSSSRSSNPFGRKQCYRKEMRLKSESLTAIRDRLALYPSVRKSNVLFYSGLIYSPNYREAKRLTLDFELSLPGIERVDQKFKEYFLFTSLNLILTYLGDKDVLIDDETSEILSEFLKGDEAKESCSTTLPLLGETNEQTAKLGDLVKWKCCDLAKSLKRAELESAISLSIPPGACLKERLDHMLFWQDQVRFVLKSPLYSSDKQDHRSTLESITEVTERLKRYENIPKSGVCIYSGLIVAKNGQKIRLTFDVEPLNRRSSSLYHHVSGPSSTFSTYYLDWQSWESDKEILLDSHASAILSELLNSKPSLPVTASITLDKAQNEAQLDSLVASRPRSLGCKTNDALIAPMLAKNKNVCKISRLLESLLASENISQIWDFSGWRKDHFIFLKPNDDIQREINSLDNHLLGYLSSPTRRFKKYKLDSLLDVMRDEAEAKKAIHDRLALYPNVRKSNVLFYTGLVKSRDGKTEKRRLTLDIELSLPGVERVDDMLIGNRMFISLELLLTYLGDVDVFIDDATSEILSDFLASRDTQGKCSSALPLPESHNNKGESTLNYARLFMRKLGNSARQVAARVFCCLG